MSEERPLAVNLYSGIYMRYDALSQSLTHKLEILRRLISRGAPLEVSVFTQGTDQPGPNVKVISSVSRLAERKEFWGADVHIFEFGMYYDLFNSVFVIPPDRSVLVVDHNTTPPELVDVPATKEACTKALLQRNNLNLADYVICVSEFNKEIARSVGVPEERMQVLHLPPAQGSLAGSLGPKDRSARRGDPDQPVRFLFVGRLVRSKGVLDLLRAFEEMNSQSSEPPAPSGRRTGRRTSLTLVGSATFSDPSITQEIDRIRSSQSCGYDIEILDRVEEPEMARLLERSDALVIPSYHEGYCVPVVEALTARCQVIGYDAGNLPNVMGGLGQLVRTGEVGDLKRAMERVVQALWARDDELGLMVPISASGTDHSEIPEVEWMAAVEEHLVDYSWASFEIGFLELLAGAAGGSPGGLSRDLESLIRQRRLELA